jgi:hypothetical protein
MEQGASRDEARDCYFGPEMEEVEEEEVDG